MPKISVVLPIYNTAVYLREAMDSVTRQTLKDIEIICVNDGSTDNSLDIIKEYAEKDNRIIVIDKLNGGYGHSMNAGMDAVTGDYLGILETDDFLALTMYEDLYTLAEKHHLDCVRGSFYRFTRNKNGDMQLQYYAIDKNLGFRDKVFNPHEDISSMKVSLQIWAGIYRLSFLREHQIRFNETPGASFQDNGFFWQVQINARSMMLVDTPYYYCRRDNPNSSVKDPEKIWAITREFDFIRGILTQDPSIWDKYHGYYWLLKFYNYNFTESRISYYLKDEFINSISVEYQAALTSNEIYPKLFTHTEWSKIQFIARCPEDYIQKNAVNQKALDDANKEKEMLLVQLNLALNAEQWYVYLLRGLKKIIHFVKNFIRSK